MIGQEIQWVAVVWGKERGLTKRLKIEPRRDMVRPRRLVGLEL